MFTNLPVKLKNNYQKKAKLTDARALLLYVLYDLVRQGEFVSEFSAEKVCYFLQKFGAKKYFKLQFKPNFYGPYSGKVRYALNYLNGSYLMDHNNLNRRPFDPLLLIPNGYENVKNYIEKNILLKSIANKTTSFLNGFYSDFALELLSSVDWIMNNKKTNNINVIKNKLNKWSKQKISKFSNDKYLQLAINHIKNFKNM